MEDQINNFERYVDNQLLLLEARINVFKQFKMLVNSEILKGDNVFDSIPYQNKNISGGKRTLNAPDSYPTRGAFTNKIRFIINSYSRAIESTDFQEMMIKEEGDRAMKKWPQFERALRGLAHPTTGELVYFHYKNSNHRFYIHHDWLTEDKNDIKPEFAPLLSVIDDIPPESIVSENIIWHKSK